MKTTTKFIPQDQPVGTLKGKSTNNPLQTQGGASLHPVDNPLQLAGNEENELLQRQHNPLQLKHIGDNPLSPITHTGNPLQQATSTPASTPYRHIAQQKQESVPPTLQMKEGIAVNDDKGLENEADVMGAQAAAAGNQTMFRKQKNTALNNKNQNVKQAKFIGEGAQIMPRLMFNAPPVFRFLAEQMEGIGREITVSLVTGGTPMNYNFSKHILELNGHLIMQGLDMRNGKIDGWRDTMGFIYSSASHELQHAYDINIGEIQTVTGEISEMSQINGLYQTELNAWSSEAIALIEYGLLREDLVGSWLNFDPGREDPENMIWQRLQHYTDNVFKKNLRGFTWVGRMKNAMMPVLRTLISNLKEKVIYRYQQAVASQSGGTSSTTGTNNARGGTEEFA